MLQAREVLNINCLENEPSVSVDKVYWPCTMCIRHGRLYWDQEHNDCVPIIRLEEFLLFFFNSLLRWLICYMCVYIYVCFFYGIGKRVDLLSEGKLFPPSKDIRNIIGVTSALLAFEAWGGRWVGVWASDVFTHSTKLSTNAISNRFSVGPWCYTGQAFPFAPKRGSLTLSCLFEDTTFFNFFGFWMLFLSTAFKSPLLSIDLSVEKRLWPTISRFVLR